jgi:hypothetical protein
MITSLAQIRFPTHQVIISRSDLYIHIFKYTDVACAYEVFTNSIAAGDYLLIEPDSQHYRVVIEGDTAWMPIYCRPSPFL